MKLSNLSPKQLIEIDACTRCGECLKRCPVYAQKGDEEIDPRGKIQAFKSFIRSQYGLWARVFGPRKLEEEFSEMVYRCTLCGECSVGCLSLFRLIHPPLFRSIHPPLREVNSPKAWHPACNV